jgi:hypothetical protein
LQSFQQLPALMVFQTPLARFHCDNWQLVREISAIGEHLKADFCHAISVFL